MLGFLIISMVWKKIKKGIPFIGIALFVYLLIKLNLIEILKQIGGINFFYFFIALIFVLVYILIQTIKWFVIARKQKIAVPFKEALKINFITDFYGLVTPGRLGSAMRADYLKKYGGGVGKGLSNFAIDKVLDLSSIFILAICLGFVFKNKISVISVSSLYILIAIFMLMVFLSLILYKKKLSWIFLRIIYKKFVPKNLKETARTTFDSFYENMPSLGFLFLAFIINFISWIINYSIAYFIGLSLGIEVSFIYYLAIFPIATIVAQIPITIGGLGTREFTLIGLFGLFGVEAVKVFSMAMLSLLITGIIPAIAAIWLIFNIKNQKTKTTRQNELPRPKGRGINR